MKQSKVYSGLVVGRLTVLHRDEEGSKPFLSKTGKKIYKLKFICECSCGSTLSVRADHLIGPTKTFSCGCLQKEAAARNGKNKKLPCGEKFINQIFHNYKKRARLANKEFSLTKEEFYKFTQKLRSMLRRL